MYSSSSIGIYGFGHPIPQDVKNEFLSRRLQGQTCEMIALDFGVSEGSVSKYTKEEIKKLKDKGVFIDYRRWKENRREKIHYDAPELDQILKEFKNKSDVTKQKRKPIRVTPDNATPSLKCIQKVHLHAANKIPEIKTTKTTRLTRLSNELRLHIH